MTIFQSDITTTIAFGPTILPALYWPRMTRNRALAGIVSGGLTVLVWKQLDGGIFELYETLPGFLFSLAAIMMVSRVFPDASGNEINGLRRKNGQ